MADSTTAKVEVEEYIRKKLKKNFRKELPELKLKLKYGGKFKCDLVAKNNSIVGFISTSAWRTINGRLGSAKLTKIRADAFWALSLKKKPKKVLFIFTDKSMKEAVKEEQSKGRFPKHFKVLFIKLSPVLSKKLAKSKRRAVREVSQGK